MACMLFTTELVALVPHIPKCRLDSGFCYVSELLHLPGGGDGGDGRGGVGGWGEGGGGLGGEGGGGRRGVLGGGGGSVGGSGGAMNHSDKRQ